MAKRRSRRRQTKDLLAQQPRILRGGVRAARAAVDSEWLAGAGAEGAGAGRLFARRMSEGHPSTER